MKFALIGCGRISPNHIAAAIANQLNIVALCDLDLTKTESILNQFDLLGQPVRQYADYREMLLVEKPDLVAIATESGNHASIALDCLAAKCNLIIEKPITLSLEDADRIIALAEHNKLVVSACHQNRFNRSVQKVREALEAGSFGRLFHGAAHVRWSRNEDYYRQAPWRGTWAQDGGSLMNQCIHNIDLLRWMMGDEIDEVMAYTDRLNHPYIEAEDLGLAIIRFKNGSYGLIEGTTNIFPKNLEETLYLFGEHGTVKVGGTSVNRIEKWAFADRPESEADVITAFQDNPPNVYGFGHTPLYADVIAAIAEHRQPYVDAYAGRRALELILAIYESAAGGQPVKLPLKKGSTLDYQERFNHG